MLGVLSFLGLLATAVATFFYARRSNLFRDQVTELANAVELHRQDLNLAKARLSLLDGEKKSLVKEVDLARSQYVEMMSRFKLLESEQNEAKKNLERKLANAELQRDHILARYDALQSEQQDHLDQSLAAAANLQKLKNQHETHISALKESQELVTGKLQKELVELRNSIKNLEQENISLKSQKEGDPKVIETLRRRAAHNEQLFYSMKSLREMSDERNKNWESALRKLATWILSSSSVAKLNDPILSQTIGPLVGEALQRIGESLLDFDVSEDVVAEQHMIDGSSAEV